MRRIAGVEVYDVERLERIRSVLYQFLVPGASEELDALELRPKTYTEAVKCYLEVDSRIDEKRGEGPDSGLGRWAEIVRRCSSSPEVMGREAGDRSPRTLGLTDSDEAAFSDAKSAGE